tara:strand:+ start:720 stop:2150 length:1431 start_codon:yes stop_codon:yes gene_type:complete
MPIACGDAHTLAIAERGRMVFAWGREIYGHLGTGVLEHQRTPVPVAGLEGLPDIVAVAAGHCHSAAVTSEGAALLWGCNNSGELGQKDTYHEVLPVTLAPPQFGGEKVKMVACGGRHTLVVTRAGGLFAFGSGDHGQLGLGDVQNRSAPVAVVVGRLGEEIIAHVAAGKDHSGVVTSRGSVWTWGSGTKGCLGSDSEEDQLVPRARALDGQQGQATALSLALGFSYTMVVTMCGAVWGFGCGENGKLGVGDRADRHVPVRVGGEETFGHSKVHMVACGDDHTMAVTEEGAVWSWGLGMEGILGHKDQRDRLEPTRVGQEVFGGAKITAIDCGLGHSVAVSEYGALFTWGTAGYTCGSSRIPIGLGHEDFEDKLVPTLVDPDLLLGTRIGRGLALEPLLALAFAMGTHHRLGTGQAQVAAGSGRGRRGKSLRAAGKEPAAPAAEGEDAGSPLQALAGELGLVWMILEMCADKVQVQP